MRLNWLQSKLEELGRKLHWKTTLSQHILYKQVNLTKDDNKYFDISWTLLVYSYIFYLSLHSTLTHF